MGKEDLEGGAGLTERRSGVESEEVLDIGDLRPFSIAVAAIMQIAVKIEGAIFQPLRMIIQFVLRPRHRK